MPVTSHYDQNVSRFVNNFMKFKFRLLDSLNSTTRRKRSKNYIIITVWSWKRINGTREIGKVLTFSFAVHAVRNAHIVLLYEHFKTVIGGTYKIFKCRYIINRNQRSIRFRVSDICH